MKKQINKRILIVAIFAAFLTLGLNKNASSAQSTQTKQASVIKAITTSNSNKAKKILSIHKPTPKKVAPQKTAKTKVLLPKTPKSTPKINPAVDKIKTQTESLSKELSKPQIKKQAQKPIQKIKTNTPKVEKSSSKNTNNPELNKKLLKKALDKIKSAINTTKTYFSKNSNTLSLKTSEPKTSTDKTEPVKVTPKINPVQITPKPIIKPETPNIFSRAKSAIKPIYHSAKNQLNRFMPQNSIKPFANYTFTQAKAAHNGTKKTLADAYNNLKSWMAKSKQSQQTETQQTTQPTQSYTQNNPNTYPQQRSWSDYSAHLRNYFPTNQVRSAAYTVATTASKPFSYVKSYFSGAEQKPQATITDTQNNHNQQTQTPVQNQPRSWGSYLPTNQVKSFAKTIGTTVARPFSYAKSLFTRTPQQQTMQQPNPAKAALMQKLEAVTSTMKKGDQGVTKIVQSLTRHKENITSQEDKTAVDKFLKRYLEVNS